LTSIRSISAVSESFFATLELDLMYRYGWSTRTAARREIFGYTEGFYNPRSLHSTLGNLSPVAYENHHSLVAQSAQQKCPSNRGRPKRGHKTGSRLPESTHGRPVSVPCEGATIDLGRALP